MRYSTLLVELVFLSVAAFLWLGIQENDIMLGFSKSAVSPTAADNVAEGKEFDWEKLEPSTTLNWSKCYDAPFQCTRFMVPLNYSEPAGPSAVIALVRRPANVTDPKDYRGPILFNPGGPGGSGVDLVIGRGDKLSVVVGPEFDIVGFDPRGIGRTAPKISWFESEIEGSLWTSAGKREVIETYEDLARIWARSQVTGKIAEERNLEAIAHLRTENVAQDMLRITEAHGYEKLQYWGFSYGTVLGATFAALFPDKVGKLILDGVADAEDYYSATWANALRDTDKSVQTFFDQCSASTPEECAFWSPTSENISSRLDALYQSIREKPLPVTIESGYGYDIVDYATLRWAVFSSLYSPYDQFHNLALGLKELEQGNGTRIISISKGTQKKLECNCGEDQLPKRTFEDVSAAIYCGDATERNEGPTELYDRFLDMYNEYSSFADVWIQLSAKCTGWRVLAPERFLGPFAGNTSNPILFIGNTADPVTPLWSARNVASGFPGSVVLTQNSGGHCSISAPSVCSAKYIRAYFVDGKLPEEDTVCEVSEPVFKPSFSESMEYQEEGKMVALSEGKDVDAELREAVRALSRDTGIAYGHMW